MSVNVQIETIGNYEVRLFPDENTVVYAHKPSITRLAMHEYDTLAQAQEAFKTIKDTIRDVLMCENISLKTKG